MLHKLTKGNNIYMFILSHFSAVKHSVKRVKAIAFYCKKITQKAYALCLCFSLCLVIQKTKDSLFLSFDYEL